MGVPPMRLDRACLGLAVVITASPAAAFTLEDAIRSALERNERVQIAQNRQYAASARVDRARAFFFPELTASANYTRRLQENVRDVGGQTVVIQAADALSANV